LKWGRTKRVTIESGKNCPPILSRAESRRHNGKLDSIGLSTWGKVDGNYVFNKEGTRGENLRKKKKKLAPRMNLGLA